MTELVAMPPKVATAVNAVMKSMKRLEKGETNKHGGYKFASVDDFYDAVRPLMADAGLIVGSDEEGFEIINTGTAERPSNWLKMSYLFELAHADGETWAHRPRRTIMVNAAMGSQAFGSAQSYAEKQYLRSLFKMSTGDPDADSNQHEQLPQRQQEEAKRVDPKPPTIAERATKLENTLKAVKTKADLDKAYKLGAGLLAELDDKDPERFQAINTLHDELQGKFAPVLEAAE